MPLLSSTKKAEQFAKLLDGSGSAGSGDLATLQGLAARLSSVPQPRAEFASALRDQLMSQAATNLPGAAGAGSAGTGSSGAGGTGTGAPGTGTGTGATGAGGATGSAASAASAVTGGATGGSAVSSLLSVTAPLWTHLVAGVAATAIAITGVGVGASRSLPGDPLYGIKRQVEAVQLDLKSGPTERALAQLDLAGTRLQELTDLLGGRQPGAPLSADMQKQVKDLLDNWARQTSHGTTFLLNQLSAGQGDRAAIRARLISFTDSQARRLAVAVQGLPDTTLESLTGSAFAYLQRVDTALGNPVNLASLLPSLGLPLPTAATPSTGATSTTTPSTGTPSTAPGSTANTPSTVPTLPIPTGGRPVPHPGVGVPTVPSVPIPTGGTGPLPKVGTGVGGVVNGVTNGATRTVDGVLQGVTGNGPSLPLPTTVPTLPKLGK